MPNRPRPATVRRLEQATGRLATAAIARMEETLPWYRAMPAAHRSWVGMVAQAGIAAFVEWFRSPDAAPAIPADVFGTAPRELTRAVTLRQTVELVRTTIGVIEEKVAELAPTDEVADLHIAVLRYSREIAFAAAQVYAQAAEARGAWDARLEALVVDAVLRGDADEAVLSRAAALGWNTHGNVVVVAGTAPDGDPEAVVEEIQRAARQGRFDVLTGVQGRRLVVVLGGAADAMAATRLLVEQFAPGPVVVGPPVPDLRHAARSARAAASGLRAAVAWPGAPRPVSADDLLPERALQGDPDARHALVHEVYLPLRTSGPAQLDTLAAFLEQAESLEGAARLLFVHPNTVRYRLRRVAEITGLVATEPRGSFALRVALVLGRLGPSEPEL